jgi:uncharacterized repeat protein (TIGR02543 family)
MRMIKYLLAALICLFMLSACDFFTNTVLVEDRLGADGGKILLTFNANGGTVSPASYREFVGVAITLPTPVRPGYTFAGWYSHPLSNDRSKLIGGGGDIYVMDSLHRTFFADWAEQ